MKTTILLSMLVLCVGLARGEEYTVTTNADSGEGSLRALCAAAAHGDTILVPGEVGTIALESVINLKSPVKGLRIVGIGDGEGRPVITAVGKHKCFHLGQQRVGGDWGASGVSQLDFPGY